MARGEQNQASTSGRRVNCPLPSWVTSYAEALDKIVHCNTPSRARCGDGNSVYLSAWHTLTDPNIPMQSYVERLWRYSGCSSAAAFGSLVYIERLALGEDSFTPTAFNIHRLLTVTLVLAMKFFQEEVYPQDYLALVGGMTGAELNLLELEVLTRLNFNAFVHEGQLQRSIDLIRSNLATGRARAFPSAKDLLDTLWDEELEVTDEPPSTPPAPTSNAQNAHVARSSSLANAHRRWSDSMLAVPGEDDEELEQDEVMPLGCSPPAPAVLHSTRMKASVSEGYLTEHAHARVAAECSLTGDEGCMGFHSLDEDLLTSGGFTAREALGALLCDEVLEEGMGTDAFDGYNPQRVHA